MIRLLNRASLRFYSRHPWQLGLAIAGISLGVGVFVGVQLASDSAARAFELSAAVVRGGTTHRLVPIGTDLDETVYRNLVMDRGVASAAPVIEAAVGIAARPGLRVPLLGVDPTQEGSLRSFAGFLPGSTGGDLTRLMTEPGTVLLPATLAAEITAALRIPTIGIGAGPECDGQILVLQDMLGMNQDFRPKFVRQFSDIGHCVQEALGRYDDAVKSGTFPAMEESYS